ncbi:single-stranded DNA-binding protein [Pseudoglutamicibacter albus]|uniref:single-stranded DNA-binding protein n=1 Tax=Pseudoglutamicibacter albus TaxID=98671 RepID=UPI00361A1BD0
MAGETIITVVGNLTADPELRFTPSGAAVANFTVASTPRIFDRQANEFKDGEALFMRCSVWREHAENVAESLTKGMRVIAQGRLRARSYDDQNGNRRTAWELDVDEVGPALRYATAQVTRNPRGGGVTKAVSAATRAASVETPAAALVAATKAEASAASRTRAAAETGVRLSNLQLTTRGVTLAAQATGAQTPASPHHRSKSFSNQYPSRS